MTIPIKVTVTGPDGEPIEDYIRSIAVRIEDARKTDRIGSAMKTMRVYVNHSSNPELPSVLGIAIDEFPIEDCRDIAKFILLINKPTIYRL